MSGETLLERTQRAIVGGRLLDAGDTVVVAVSGGADSVALLDALVHLAAPLGVTLHVAHLDHGLRPDSADDAQFVADLAHRYGLPLTVAAADIAGHAAAHGLSLEEAGREARYAFLGALAATLGARRIATAHHADDQAETVLARLLRGAGLDGLGGMRPLAPLPPTADVPFGAYHTDLSRPPEGAPPSADVRVIRPFLGLRRHELRAYLAIRGLPFRDDPTNRDTTLLRNRLRHEILPRLAAINPAVVETLARAATLMADDADTLAALTEAAWPAVARPAADAIELDLAALAAQPVAMRRRLLRAALARLGGGRDVGAAHIERALRLAAEGAPGEQAHLPGGIVLTRGYAALTVSRGAPPDPDWPLLPPGAPPLAVTVPGVTAMGEWSLRVERGAWSVERSEIRDWRRGEGVGGRWSVVRGERMAGNVAGGQWSLVREELIDAAATEGGLWLRARRPGESFAPLGMGGQRQSLHDFMIHRRVPRQVRDRVPLLVNAQGVVWVVGLRLDEGARVTADTASVLRVSIARDTAA